MKCTGIISDLRVILRLLRGASSGASHAERLENFYASQAADYDRFRERLLKGRAELVDRLAPQPGEYWAELGGGTGRNLDFLGPQLAELRRFDLVDLCEPLLAEARRRCRDFENVLVIRADAGNYAPEEPLDVLFFSYALSMMDGWSHVVDCSRSLLKAGGRIGVVDFFVSSPAPAAGRARHGALARAFWPRWFAHDGVHLSPDLPDLLLRHFPGGELREYSSPVPWLPGLRVPYFVFIAST